MGTRQNLTSKLAPVELHRDDCLSVFSAIPDGSVELVIADLPYGVTGCHWDSKIDLVAFWVEVRRILSPLGTVLMFGTQPFSSELIVSNPAWFSHELIWQKSKPTLFQFCRQRHLSEHENILVFTPGVVVGKHRSDRQMTYNPQGLTKLAKPVVRKARTLGANMSKTRLKGSTQKWTNFPRSILEYASVAKPTHETEKPVELLRYLIRTFSNEGETVLDPTMGSGSTGEAAVHEARNFVGSEMDADFFARAAQRVRKATDALALARNAMPAPGYNPTSPL